MPTLMPCTFSSLRYLYLQWWGWQVSGRVLTLPLALGLQTSQKRVEPGSFPSATASNTDPLQHWLSEIPSKLCHPSTRVTRRHGTVCPWHVHSYYMQHLLGLASPASGRFQFAVFYRMSGLSPQTVTGRWHFNHYSVVTFYYLGLKRHQEPGEQ
jgi:hypothetical protein